MESLWEQTWEQPNFPAQDKNINTDILIIGGGMAGILCAYQLHCTGVPYVLAEAETICSGITKNTTAKITSQHGLIYNKLISRFGIERAKQYLAANEAALQKYWDLCQDIDCDFEEKAAYTYSLSDRREIEKELNALEKLSFPAEFVHKLPLPFPIVGAVRFPNQAQFHPLKFVSGIAKNLHIYEHTQVRELIGTTAVTNHGRIRAKKIIVTTHFPFLNKHGSYFLKLYQHRSYVKRRYISNIIFCSNAQKPFILLVFRAVLYYHSHQWLFFAQSNKTRHRHINPPAPSTITILTSFLSTILLKMTFPAVFLYFIVKSTFPSLLKFLSS